MNEHIVAALIGALIVAVFVGLVLWEVRQYTLAKKGVGQPCKHGKPRNQCPLCRRKFSLFGLFDSRESDSDCCRKDGKSEKEQRDVPEAPSGDEKLPKS